MIKAIMFDTRQYDKEFFVGECEKNSVKLKTIEAKLNEDTVELAKGYECVIVFVNDDVNGTVIERLAEGGTKLIALRCAGYNNVDVKAAFGKIHIVRVPAYSPEAVAEHAMALLLTSVRKIHKSFIRTRDFNFTLNGLVGFNLHGKTAGVVGTGKIGKRFIDICRGFGMRVIAYDPFPDTSAGIEYVTLDSLFRESDVISLHCPLTKDTKHLINERSIGTMKDGVVIVNTSRGALIESEALIEGIKKKKIGGACLDVYEEESDLFFEDLSGEIVEDDVMARLLTLPNVIVTSHQGFLTDEALSNIASVTVRNIVRFFGEGVTENEICYLCENVGECRKDRKKRCF